MRHRVEDADRADRAVLVADRYAGAIAHAQRAAQERAVAKARVELGIGDLDRRARAAGLGTKRGAAGFEGVRVDAMHRLVPDPLTVDEADDGS